MEEKERRVIIIGSNSFGVQSKARDLAMKQGLDIVTELPKDPTYFKATTEKLSESIIAISKEINDLNKTYYEPKGSKYHK